MNIFYQIKNRSGTTRKFNPRQSASNQKGHTLAELLVVVAIISLLSGISIYNYKVNEKRDALILETQKVAQMIRRAQNLSLSPQISNVGRNYGVHFNRSTNTIILFGDNDSADNNSDTIYDSGEKIDELILDSKTKIKSMFAPTSDDPVNNRSFIRIIFRPPDPITEIYNSENGMAKRVDTTITISLKDDDTKFKKIFVNQASLVEIQ